MLNYEIGCNYFHLGYPFDLAEMGKTIVSNFIISEELNEYEANLGNFIQEDVLKTARNKEIKTIDLNDKIYESDTELIKRGCQCFTCKNNYTKAYIHHLLKCKELNASILIAM